MKLLVLVVAALAACVSAEEPIGLYYHENVGIPLAARIKEAEEALDFDGSRIVGGSPASLGAVPWQGGLLITLQSGGTSVCGSSLLTNNRLVTAAHCWFDGRQNARQLTVVLGSTLLFSGGTRVTTSNVQVHANYNTNNLNNDIAIILTGWINYNNNVQPIALPSGSQLNSNYAGSWAHISGFGRTSDSSGISTNQFLSQATVQVITNAVCASTYGSSVVANSVICTSAANGIGTCGGDSGGPLSVVSGNRILIGVVSFGAAAGCQVGLPNGYARTTSFNDWIRARL